MIWINILIVLNNFVEMRQFVPDGNLQTAQFRADLAGLLVVSMAASYESCVKETLVTYASNHNQAFGDFATRNYSKLNSRVSISDLHSYAKIFDGNVRTRFKKILDQRSRRIDGRIGRKIEASYEQVLNWRHAFAHAGVRNTTIEEAIVTHRLGKRVLYAFDDAFNRALPP